MTVIQCPYEPPHTHEFPEDWKFGGPTGSDPRCDERWQTVVYEYFDASLRLLHATVVPLCEDEALDRFTEVAGYGPGFDPVYISANKQMLPWQYNKKTDTVTPIGGEQ